MYSFILDKGIPVSLKHRTIRTPSKSSSVNGKLDTTPKYSVTEASKMSGLSAHTLRYYDDLGLFPFLKRTQGVKNIVFRCQYAIDSID